MVADTKRQLYLAVLAVFDSWDSPRANKYRSINQIKGLKGTAVNVQCMVFGNMGNTSGTGVLFTRNPSTGEKKLYGEFLINAQVLKPPQEIIIKQQDGCRSHRLLHYIFSFARVRMLSQGSEHLRI